MGRLCLDIKPENVLVTCCQPISVKLGDLDWCDYRSRSKLFQDLQQEQISESECGIILFLIMTFMLILFCKSRYWDNMKMNIIVDRLSRNMVSFLNNQPLDDKIYYFQKVTRFFENRNEYYMYFPQYYYSDLNYYDSIVTTQIESMQLRL